MTSCLVSSASALAAPAAGVIVIMGIMTLPCSERSNGLRSHSESMSQASLGLQGLPCGLSLPPVLICYPLPSSPLATPASLPFLTPARYALTWGLCASFSFCLEYSPSRYLRGFPNLILLQVFAQLSPSQRDFLTTRTLLPPLALSIPCLVSFFPTTCVTNLLTDYAIYLKTKPKNTATKNHCSLPVPPNYK